MNGKEILGREIKVDISWDRADNVGGGHVAPSRNEPSRNLFVANIPSEVVEDDLYRHFENFGKGGMHNFLSFLHAHPCLFLWLVPLWEFKSLGDLFYGGVLMAKRQLCAYSVLRGFVSFSFLFLFLV